MAASLLVSHRALKLGLDTEVVQFDQTRICRLLLDATTVEQTECRHPLGDTRDDYGSARKTDAVAECPSGVAKRHRERLQGLRSANTAGENGAPPSSVTRAGSGAELDLLQRAIEQLLSAPLFDRKQPLLETKLDLVSSRSDANIRMPLHAFDTEPPKRVTLVRICSGVSALNASRVWWS
ncbi:hypothetical protein ACVWZV_003155 [Bradyrhizobium sp. GM5.1]